MNLIRPRAILVVALSVMVFTATASVLVGLERAPSSFAADSGYVVTSPGAPTIFSSVVDANLATAINRTSGYEGASPEIFAFSSFNGIPFVLRGIDWGLFSMTGPALSHVERLDGSSGLSGNEALVGSGLLGRLGIKTPYNLSVTASYQPRMKVLDVVGWFESSSSLNDELLVTLDVARDLSGIAADKVSIVRMSSLSAEVKDVLTPEGPRFAIYDFTGSKSRVVLGEEFALGVTVKNWGTARGQVNVSFTEWNSTLGASSSLYTIPVTLDSGSEARIAHNVSFEDFGLKDLGAEIDGKDASKIDIAIDVVSSWLALWGPDSVALGSSFEVTVADYAGHPVVGAVVDFLNQTAVTDASGKARLNATNVGDFVMSASYPGLQNGSWSLSVVDLGSYPNSFNPIVTRFTILPYSFKETESGELLVVVENRGRLGGQFTKTIYLDSARFRALNVSLGPAETLVLTYQLDDISVGYHTLALGSSSAAFSVYPWYSEDQSLVQLAVKYGGTLKLSSATAIPMYQAAKLSQGEVDVAVMSVLCIAGTLAVLSVTSILAKEIHEGRAKLGVLRTIGAPRSAIRLLILRQSLAVSVVGAAIGVMLGLALAVALLESGSIMIFGHAIISSYSIGSSVAGTVILIGSVVICVATSLAAAEVAARSTPISSIRKTEEDRSDHRTVDEALGEE